MVHLARDLGWLSEDERWAELARMLGELQARSVVRPERSRSRLHAEPGRRSRGAFQPPRPWPGSPADRRGGMPPVRACLGSAKACANAAGLVRPSEADARIAQGLPAARPSPMPPSCATSPTPSPACPASDCGRCARWRRWAGHYLSDRDIPGQADAPVLGDVRRVRSRPRSPGILIRARPCVRSPVRNWCARCSKPPAFAAGRRHGRA